MGALLGPGGEILEGHFFSSPKQVRACVEKAGKISSQNTAHIVSQRVGLSVTPVAWQGDPRRRIADALAPANLARHSRFSQRGDHKPHRGGRTPHPAPAVRSSCTLSLTNPNFASYIDPYNLSMRITPSCTLFHLRRTRTRAPAASGRIARQVPCFLDLACKIFNIIDLPCFVRERQ